MSGAFTVRGGDELARTLAHAGAELADMTPINGRVGDMLLDAARPRTPVRTGRLVGSLRDVADVAGVRLTSDLVYAGPIHNGWPAHHIAANPFLTRAVEANTGRALELYAGEIDRVLEGVHGA